LLTASAVACVRLNKAGIKELQIGMDGVRGLRRAFPRSKSYNKNSSKKYAEKEKRQANQVVGVARYDR
jgi:hypothetical protein